MATPSAPRTASGGRFPKGLSADGIEPWTEEDAEAWWSVHAELDGPTTATTPGEDTIHIALGGRGASAT